MKSKICVAFHKMSQTAIWTYPKKRVYIPRCFKIKTENLIESVKQFSLISDEPIVFCNTLHLFLNVEPFLRYAKTETSHFVGLQHCYIFQVLSTCSRSLNL